MRKAPLPLPLLFHYELWRDSEHLEYTPPFARFKSDVQNPPTMPLIQRVPRGSVNAHL